MITFLLFVPIIILECVLWYVYFNVDKYLEKFDANFYKEVMLAAHFTLLFLFCFATLVMGLFRLFAG